MLFFPLARVGFQLDFSSPHPISAPKFLNKPPVCVFLLDFLFKNPRCVFFYLIFPLYTQFPLRNFLISFRFVFFCLIFLSKTHDVCFSACFFLFTPKFRSETSRLASGLCFFARFSYQKPTTCVFPLDFSYLHPVFAPGLLDKLPVWVFLLIYTFPRPYLGCNT